MKPVTLNQVQAAIPPRFTVNLMETTDGVQVTAHTSLDMEAIKGNLRVAGVLYNDGPQHNVITCYAIKGGLRLCPLP